METLTKRGQPSSLITDLGLKIGNKVLWLAGKTDKYIVTVTDIIDDITVQISGEFGDGGGNQVYYKNFFHKLFGIKSYKYVCRKFYTTKNVSIWSLKPLISPVFKAKLSAYSAPGIPKESIKDEVLCIFTDTPPSYTHWIRKSSDNSIVYRGTESDANRAFDKWYNTESELPGIPDYYVEPVEKPILVNP